jgi:hypothetical protein
MSPSEGNSRHHGFAVEPDHPCPGQGQELSQDAHAPVSGVAAGAQPGPDMQEQGNSWLLELLAGLAWSG